MEIFAIVDGNSFPLSTFYESVMNLVHLNQIAFQIIILLARDLMSLIGIVNPVSFSVDSTEHSQLFLFYFRFPAIAFKKKIIKLAQWANNCQWGSTLECKVTLLFERKDNKGVYFEGVRL